MRGRGLDPPDLERGSAIRAVAAGHPCPPATLADVVDHVEHVREVAGVDHVGLGGDFDGTTDRRTGLADVAGYPALFAALLDRGWSEADCARLAGGNILRALRAADRRLEFPKRAPREGRTPTLVAVATPLDAAVRALALQVNRETVLQSPCRPPRRGRPARHGVGPAQTRR